MDIVKNSIRKQAIDFRYNGNTDGVTLQQEVAEWVKDTLNPAIENLLNEYGQTEDIIVIDHLDLTISIDGDRDWKKILQEKLVSELKEKLQIKMRSGTAGVVNKTVSQSFLDTLKYFVQYGVLPWQSSIRNKAAFEKEIEEWLKQAPWSDMKDLFDHISTMNEAKRLLAYVNKDSIEIFIKKVLQQPEEERAEFIENIKLRARHLDNTTPFLDKLNKAIGSRPPYGRESELTKNLLKDIKEVIIHVPGDLENDPAPEFVNELKEGIFTNYAGAVIIAPFLPALFSKTGLLNNEGITDIPSAICLLHYCITGNTEPAEFELLLPKILCGAPIENEISLPGSLDEHIKAEADNMLTAVIEHWTVIKNTSVNGLRESFLQREGKLSMQKDQWLLQVEQKPYDMLLQQLPWGISHIHLSWMKNTLLTEWI